MINVITKVHDKFSIEFKVGFAGSERDTVNDFTVNSWIFVPNNLDINSTTYGKEQFYRDVKSNIRLITPDLLLSELADAGNEPLRHIQDAQRKYLEQTTQANLEEYHFQCRMFAAIFKSALRNEVVATLACADPPSAAEGCLRIVRDVERALRLYRDTRSGSALQLQVDVFAFADEFMSHIADVQATKLVQCLDDHPAPGSGAARDALVTFLQRERDYKSRRGYSHLTEGDTANNRELVLRHGLLKKNIESALYLKADTKPVNKAAQQLFFAIAAGIAMFVYVLITLPLQKYFGNYPTLILVILVVSYILKDRIKENFRGRFAYRLKDKYYDGTTLILFKDLDIGWIKEGMDFIDESKTPGKVLELRQRTDIEASNAFIADQTLLYRKQVHIDNDRLRDHYR